MATRIYTGAGATAGPAQIALATGENLIITRGAPLSVDDGIAVIGQNGGHRLAIAGDIAASEQGISLTGSGNQVTVAGSGSITSGEAAIAIGGVNIRIINNGTLTALSEFAITLTNVVSTDVPPGTGLANVFNSGVIRGGISSTGNLLTLSNYGLIVGQDTYAPGPITVQGSSSFDYVLNVGTIEGTIQLGGGADTLINRGNISGYVNMGAGSDLVDNRLGYLPFTVLLGDDDDTYRPGEDRDIAYGGAGIDTIDFANSGPIAFALDGSIAATGVGEGDTLGEFENVRGSSKGSDLLIGDAHDNMLDGRGGNDDLQGASGNDTIIGGSGDDRLSAGSGDDSLSGGAGQDQLFGDEGKDILNGGDGNDALTGGFGADVLTGGAGADVFRFSADTITPSSPADSYDVIKDFTAYAGDRIDLSGIDAIAGNVIGSNPVNDVFTWIGNEKFHKTAGELRYVVTLSGYVLQGDVTGDGLADFSIKLAGVKAISVDDLTL